MQVGVGLLGFSYILFVLVHINLTALHVSMYIYIVGKQAFPCDIHLSYLFGLYGRDGFSCFRADQRCFFVFLYGVYGNFSPKPVQIARRS